MPDDDLSARLRAALDDAARLRQQNASLTRERDTTAARLRDESAGRLGAEEVAINNAIAQVETELGSYESKIAELGAEGKFPEQASVTRKMTDASAKLASYRQQAADLAYRKTQVQQQPTSAPQPAQQLTSREQTWIDNHPSFNADPVFRRKAIAASNAALELHGIERDSDAYFDFINRAVNPSTGGGGNDNPKPPSDPSGVSIPTSPPPESISIPAVAPPSNEPAMSLETEMVDQMYPQQRAIGRGGPGISSVAAPPTRRIVELSNQHARGAKIEPTLEELEAARAIVRDVAPQIIDEAAKSGQNVDEAIIRTYHAWYNSPASQRKLRRWYGRDAA